MLRFALRLISKTPKYDHVTKYMLGVLRWLPVRQHIEYSRLSGLAVPAWPCTRLPYRSLSASVGGPG